MIMLSLTGPLSARLSYTLLDSDLEEGMGQGTCGILFKHSAPLKGSQQDTKGQTISCVALSLAG